MDKVFEAIEKTNRQEEGEDELEDEEKCFSIFPFKRRLCGIYQPI